MFVAKHPRNIPSAYHKPIGQLLARWSVTELYLQSIIWHIWQIRDPKAARLLTWDLQAVAKIKLFGYLPPRWITDQSQRDELKVIANKADELRAKRNHVAHGLWGYKPGEPKKLYLIRASRDKRIQPKAELVTANDVKGWAAELDDLNRQLIAFHRGAWCYRPMRSE